MSWKAHYDQRAEDCIGMSIAMERVSGAVEGEEKVELYTRFSQYWKDRAQLARTTYLRWSFFFTTLVLPYSLYKIAIEAVERKRLSTEFNDISKRLSAIHDAEYQENDKEE